MRSRLWIGALSAVVALAVISACAPSAGGTWVAVPPTANPQSELDSVSCVTATWCLATGRVTDDTGTFALVQRWNGTTWSDGPALPTAIADADIRTITCAAVNRCVAVGRRGEGAFLARLVGSTWTDESGALSSTNAFYLLTDVWCGDGTCIAVGPGSLNVAFSSTGGAWTQMPTPPGYQGMAMPGRLNLQIDCASARSCAVVYAVATSQVGGVATYWNGTTWTDPETTGGRLENTALFGVDCPQVGTCFATGTAQATTEEYPPGVIATFDGSSWNLTRLQQPGLGAISCATVDRCIVPRQGLFTPGGLDGMVRNRGRWSPVRTPTPDIGEYGTVGDVSCVPGGDVCLAVGTSEAGAFAYRWRF